MDVRYIGHVHHELVHADPAHHGAGLAVDLHDALPAAQQAGIAVGVARAEGSDLRRLFGRKTAAIAGRLTRLQLLDHAHHGLELHHRAEQPEADGAAGVEAVEDDARAGHAAGAFQPLRPFRVEHDPGGVVTVDKGGLVPGGFQRLECLNEQGVLLGGVGHIGLVRLIGHGKVLEQAGHCKAWQLAGVGHLLDGLFKIRAERIGNFGDSLKLLCETNLDTIKAVIDREKPQIVVIDSIQTMFNEEVSSAPGSVSQVRESTGVLMQIAKGMGISIFIVGHVTKEGVVAGPRVLEHMVDTVLYFEGDRHAAYRILRGVKNRFGSTNEIGVFEMRQDGLVEVENPSEYMLSGKPEGASGSVVACSMEGTRPILLEVQALVCHSNFGIPRRTAAGTDFNRVNLLMAVLEKRLGLKLGDCDAYVNIAGGIKMNEPAIDLGIVLAIISSYKDKPIDEKTICFGEVGLSGEVRAVNMAEQRIQEAKKLGFEVCILPEVCKKTMPAVQEIRLIGVSSLYDAMEYLKK